MSTIQPAYPMSRVSWSAPDLSDHELMTRNDRSQWGPNAADGGNATVLPARSMAEIAPEKSG